ncbi:hypothetical protein P3W45_000142 [Vairimorpha bombi]|jgi:splicing factor 3B subunit 2
MRREDVPKDYIFIRKNGKEKMNKKTKKKLYREMLYNNLIKESSFPHLVEIEDVKCEDPIFYTKLKNVYKIVPVIKRWKSKQIFPVNYKKKEYSIPTCIINTGLDLLRYNLIQMKKDQTDKTKYMEKMFPKLGKSAINPQKLYECFHKNILSPFLYEYGDVFDFTWEHERKRYLPGVIDDELKKVLGMDEFSPPPWLFKMQKIGLPPSYPDIKVPGVNANIPPGCKYGYEPNGWGKPLSNFVPEDKDEYIFNLENQYTDIKPVLKIDEQRVSNEDHKLSIKEDDRDIKKFKFNGSLSEENVIDDLVITEKNMKDKIEKPLDNKKITKKKKDAKSKLRQKL